MELSKEELLLNAFNFNCSALSSIVQLADKHIANKDFVGKYLTDLSTLQFISTIWKDTFLEKFEKKYGSQFIEDSVKKRTETYAQEEKIYNQIKNSQ